MADNKPFHKMTDAIRHYYYFCPDTLMPMLMLAMAKQGKLSISNRRDESKTLFCILDLDEISRYDWVALNPSLRERVMKELYAGKASICVEGVPEGPMREIYDLFFHYDHITVEEELHYRSGRLKNHSGNRASEEAHRQYAMLCLAEALLSVDNDWLSYNYLAIANDILEISGLQPARPRMDVARALCALLQYNGRGNVYNPFAGCGIAAAMVDAGDRMYADGDINDKLFSVARLLNYGLSGCCSHYAKHDSTQWRKEKFDYVLSTYMGYVNGRTAFDYRLRRCLDTPSFRGRYAGMINPRSVFEHPSAEWKEALERDWVDMIILMPFGELAVLINANKDSDSRGCVRFLDMTVPWITDEKPEDLIDDEGYVDYLSTEDVKKEGFLRSQIPSPDLNAEGCIKLKLSDLVERIPRQVYDLNGGVARVIRINREVDYIGSHEANRGFDKWRIEHIYSPVYKLTGRCLIVNSKGKPEPRLVTTDGGPVYFEEGFAFAVKDDVDIDRLIDELNESYIEQQLYPYGIHPMVPEQLTEDAFLNLVLFMEDEHEQYRAQRNDALQNCLPDGFMLSHGQYHYYIRRFIGNGAFGYTYMAEMENILTGKTEIVALKEYFPRIRLNYGCKHDADGRVVYPRDRESLFREDRVLFEHEPQYMERLNRIPNHHVSELRAFFRSETTGTSYYAMKYYNGLTLDDLIRNNQVPQSHKLLVDKIIYPLCQALYAMHSQHVLHLDIKPENVVLDADGTAVLLDFGVAQEYDTEGRLIGERGVHSSSEYSAPENTVGEMRYFAPHSDIYGLAATLYHLISRKKPIRTTDEMDERKRIHQMIEPLRGKCGKALGMAMIDGMSLYENERPRDAADFLKRIVGPYANLYPL